MQTSPLLASTASYLEKYADSRVGADIGAALASCADRRVVVTDHTKFQDSAQYPILPPDQIDAVVTDALLDEATRARFSMEPYELIYAEEDSPAS